MVQELNKTVFREKVAGIKARAAKVITKYSELLEPLLTDYDLLEIVTTQLRIACPQKYKQLNLNQPIRSYLQKAGVIEPGGTSFFVNRPVKVDINDLRTFNGGRYNATIVKPAIDFTANGSTIEKNSLLKVTMVDIVNETMTFSLVKSDVNDNPKDVKFSLETTSQIFNTVMDSADFYSEMQMNISKGDVVFSYDNPNELMRVSEIQKEDIILVTLSSTTVTISRRDVALRDLCLAYATYGDVSTYFSGMTSIIMFEGEDSQLTNKSYMKSILESTRENLYLYDVDKPKRKSVQITVSSGISAIIDAHVRENYSSHKHYIQMLMQDLVNNSTVEQLSEITTILVLYTAPAGSKTSAFWIDGDIYESFKEFCNERKLKINPVANHLVLRDLQKEGLIQFDSAYL